MLNLIGMRYARLTQPTDRENKSMNRQMSLTNQKVSILAVKRWRKAFSGIRPCILVWYFVLTTLTVLVSIQVTRKIYCDRLKTQADAFLLQEVERFKLLVEPKNSLAVPPPQNTAAIFDLFLSGYAPTRNEYIITLIGDRVYKISPALPKNHLAKYSTLLKKWSQLTHQAQGRLQHPNLRVAYVVQPVNIGGDRGTAIVLYDTTAEYQAGNNAISLVIQVTLVILIFSSVLAWITAGRVLSPLRLLTKTTQSIAEADMTRRIPVKGTDEIAELTFAFNEMLDRLQLAFDSQKTFLKDVSHELRTPITVVQGHLEMLKYKPQQQEETIALVMDELERMSRLVNDLLLLAKAERPDFLQLSSQEIDWLTEEIYLKVQTLAQRDWQLESKGLSPIIVDRQRLTQAMVNLVENATRHTQEGDTIALGSSVKDGHAYFWVRDTGKGIVPEDRERIFKRFVRGKNESDRSYEGTGLGLSIVEAIAQGHNGWVELNTRPGQGSTFTVVIPLTSYQESANCEPNSNRRGQPSHHFLFRNRIASSRIRDGECQHGSRSHPNGTSRRV